MDRNETHGRRRQTFLAVLLASLAALFAMFVLILFTGAYFFYGVLVLGAMVLLGMMHYLLWGRAMSRSVEGEREEEQLRQRAAAEGWPLPDPHDTRRM